MTNASDEPPCMSAKVFTSGRIRRAAYDRAARQLDLHWDNKAMLAYQQVPEEVFRRLCNAPNPAAYWEDRIADEYRCRSGSGAEVRRPVWRGWLTGQCVISATPAHRGRGTVRSGRTV